MESESTQQPSHLDNLREAFHDPIKVAYGFTGASIDGHLQELVDMVNESEFGLAFGISLFTSGGVVSGTLIGYRRYFEEFGATFKGGFENTFPDADFQSVEDRYMARASRDIELRRDGEYSPGPQYIHLIDAQLHGTNGKLSAGGGFLWRGKINSIDGYFLGVITP